MAIKENTLPIGSSSGTGTYVRTVSSGGESQRTPFDTLKGAITDDIDDALDGKVDKVTGKGLSTNDFTTAEKNKLAGIQAGAQVNTIETVKVNGTALVPDANKAVDVPAPTVDSALSESSTNPVQNKVVTGAIFDLKEDITNFADTYTVADLGYWLKEANSTAIYTNSPAVSEQRTIIVPIIGGLTYRVHKTLATKGVIGVFNSTSSGATTSNYVARPSTAGEMNSVLTTQPNDIAIIIELWSNGDSSSNKNIQKNVNSLTVTVDSRSLAKYEPKKLRVDLERGNMSSGYHVPDYTETIEHSVYNIKLNEGDSIYIPDIGNNFANATGLYMYRYDSNYERIGTESGLLSNRVYVADASTKYVKFLISHTSGYPDIEKIYIVVNSKETELLTYNFNIKDSNKISIQFLYKVSSNTYNSGRLMLPPNYDPNGKPVPLIVYFHGSAQMNKWEDEIGVSTSGDDRSNELTYLTNEGYAVFDCYGWTSKYRVSYLGNNAAENPFVCPTTLQAYVEGIKYVLSRYNIKSDVFMFGNSLGGELTTWFTVNSFDGISVKATAMLAPQIDTLGAGHLGYRQITRKILVNEWMLDDEDNIFVNGNVDEEQYGQHYFNARSASGRAFVEANINHFAGIDPEWRYVGAGVNIAEKLNDSLAWHNNWPADKDEHGQSYADWEDDVKQPNASRPLVCPTKIWIAEDDYSVSIAVANEFVKQANNAGSEAYLRPIEAGHGGHHAVDTSEDAERQSGTTTLGYTYTDVALAYVEMIEWFRRWSPEYYPTPV